MGPELSEEAKDLVGQRWARNFHISFFKGSPLNPDDMERVKVQETSMVFIIADFNSQNAHDEDRYNIMLYVNLSKVYPDLDFRLMIYDSAHTKLALNCGVDPLACFGVDGLQAVGREIP